MKTVPIGAAGFPDFKLTVEVEVLIAAISLRPVGVLLTIIPTVKPVTSANETSLLVIAVVEVFVSELQVLTVETVVGPRATPVGVKVEVDDANADHFPDWKVCANAFLVCALVTPIEGSIEAAASTMTVTSNDFNRYLVIAIPLSVHMLLCRCRCSRTLLY